MSPIAYYAIIVAGWLVLCMGCGWIQYLGRQLHEIQCWLWVHLCRHQPMVSASWLGRRTWWTIGIQLALMGAHLLLIFLPSTDIRRVAGRAGELAVLHLAVFCLGPHLSYQADCLHLRLADMRFVHGCLSGSLVLAVALHAIILKPNTSAFTDGLSQQLYGIIAALAMATILVLCWPFVRRQCYELFLRSHQLLAVGTLWAVWGHVYHTTIFARYTIIGSVGCLVLVTVMQLFHVLWVHRCFYAGFPRAHITRMGNATRVAIWTPRRYHVRPGQYINLWLPGLGWRSFWESHPFYVVFVHHRGHGTLLELMVQPRRGWTARLWMHARSTTPNHIEAVFPSPDTYLAVFSGPHGQSIRVEEYGVVVLIASGWGLMAQMPYLQVLIRGHREGVMKARRIHLIWQLDTAAEGAAAHTLLNRTLAQDTTDDSDFFNISVYRRQAQTELQLGRRVTSHAGDADWRALIADEVAWTPQDIERRAQMSSPDQLPLLNPSAFAIDQRHTIVMVSATSDIRYLVHEACRPHLSPRIRLAELEFQPDDERTANVHPAFDSSS